MVSVADKGITERVVPIAVRLSAGRACSLPVGFALALLAFGLLPAVRANPRLWGSFAGASIALLVWSALLLRSSVGTRRTFTLEVVLRKQHYVQACAHTAIFLYWGWYWRPVYDAAPLILGQLVFAYAFDMLLSWSRRDSYTLGFGPFPIIFSTNLFLWFRPDWFYLQFLMVAVGFAGKELIRWNKEGRLVHIFNPSSFTLAIFSLALLVTGMSDITWGRDIAITQFYPPHMYLFLFLIALPGQFFFGVTAMTLAAVVTTYLVGLAYFAATGTYFFFDSYIPIAVFLGMHLLFTDPSTSPRTELGRLIFGCLYGLSVIVAAELLDNVGLPTFYDKLLPVPLLNLSITLIDRAVRARPLRRLDPAALGRRLAPRQRHLAYMTIWAIVFATMSAVHAVGDGHRGQSVPFWQQACVEDRPYGCLYLSQLETAYCGDGSGWACNELGVLKLRRESDRLGAEVALSRGCRLGFQTACTNVEEVRHGGGAVGSAPPTLVDYPIILRAGKAPITDLAPSALYARACDQGWADTCAGAQGVAGASNNP
jgi:hypothetical protein